MTTFQAVEMNILRRASHPARMTGGLCPVAKTAQASEAGLFGDPSGFACRLAMAAVFGTSVTLACSVTASAQLPLLQGWFLSEFQPDVPNGGRANTIAVHPTNNS